MNNKASVLKAALAARKSAAPSAGMSSSTKSAAVKQAHTGKDIGKKNIPGKTGFGAVANKAASEYGSKAAGQKVAGAIYWKMMKRGA